MFNYPSFCKRLELSGVRFKIRRFFENQQSILQDSLNNHKIRILEQELLKLFMSQIPSLKTLFLGVSQTNNFTIYPGAKDCLKYLSELYCYSNIPELYYQLSQICQKLSSLTITVNNIIVSSGLAKLISVQKNL